MKYSDTTLRHRLVLMAYSLVGRATRAPLLWAVSQRLILKVEQSGLQTHIAAMESDSLCVRMKS
jgi:hypothetical protein